MDKKNQGETDAGAEIAAEGAGRKNCLSDTRTGGRLQKAESSVSLSGLP